MMVGGGGARDAGGNSEGSMGGRPRQGGAEQLRATLRPSFNLLCRGGRAGGRVSAGRPTYVSAQRAITDQSHCVSVNI